MASFEIADMPLSAPVRTQQQREQSVHAGVSRFTVTNTAGYGVTGQASIWPEGEARKEWFALEGEAVRQFAAGSIQVFPVKITAPGQTPGGRYGFRFRISNENDPDNDFTESPLVVFDLPAPQAPTAKKKSPWPLILGAAAVLLLLVVGGAVFLLTRERGKDAPDLVGRQYAEAHAALTAMGLELAVRREEEERPAAKPDTVVAQTPAAGRRLAKGAQVTLTVARAKGAPDVVGRTYDNAVAELNSLKLGLDVSRKDILSPGATPGTVTAQQPAQGAPLPRDSHVILTVAAPAIQVTQATYGGNCRAPAGNVTKALAEACNNKRECSYRVYAGNLGDPSFGCAKDFVVRWTCGPGTRSASESVAAEAGSGNHVVSLSC